MIPFDALDDVVTGTSPEWIVLVLLLPFVGFAVARSWGPSGVLAAQRALLVLAADLVFALVLALPLDTTAFLLASLPVLGAAASRARPTLADRPWTWLGAALFAVPSLAAAHLDPVDWPAWWFIGFLGAALARGLAEPAWDRLRPAAVVLRERIAKRARSRRETSVK